MFPPSQWFLDLVLTLALLTVTNHTFNTFHSEHVSTQSVVLEYCVNLSFADCGVSIQSVVIEYCVNLALLTVVFPPSQWFLNLVLTFPW